MSFIKKEKLGIVFLAMFSVALFLFVFTQNALAEELQENEIEWTRYPEVNTDKQKQGFGNVVWGGGSFMKLISKLSIEGCDVNAFIAVTPEGEKLFHHFQAPDFVNRDFGDGSYMRIIPAGSAIGFSCVDACDIFIGPGAGNAKEETCIPADDIMVNLYQRFDFQTNCIKDFTGEVERQFFSYVPIFQDICVAYFQRETSQEKGWGSSYLAISNYADLYYYMSRQSFIIAYNDHFTTEIDKGIYSDYFSHIQTILHELCHQHQDWYTNKFYKTYDSVKYNNQNWYKTTQAKEFISTIGYIYDEEEGYYLEEDNPYNFVSVYYSTSPLEFSAEVCSNYMLETIYKNEHPELFEGVIERGLRNAMITPETIEWMEKYVAVV